MSLDLRYVASTLWEYSAQSRSHRMKLQPALSAHLPSCSYRNRGYGGCSRNFLSTLTSMQRSARTRNGQLDIRCHTHYCRSLSSNPSIAEIVTRNRTLPILRDASLGSQGSGVRVDSYNTSVHVPIGWKEISILIGLACNCNLSRTIFSN